MPESMRWRRLTTHRVSCRCDGRCTAPFPLTAGLAGWMSSRALTLEKLVAFKCTNHVIARDVNPGVSCGKAMQTWQCSAFDVPNMFIGIVASAVITTGMAILSGPRHTKAQATACHAHQ